MSTKQITPETILRTLGLPACCTLEYYWEDMHFLPTETIPHSFLEQDYGMQEALLRLKNRTGLAQKMKKGWRLGPDVYYAVLGMTAEDERRLYRSELIRQVITGALEKYGVVSMAQLSDFFRLLNMSADVWQAAYADLFDAAYYEYIDEEDGTTYVVHPAAEDAAELLEARCNAGVFSVTADPCALRLANDYLPDAAEMYFPALEWLNRQGVSPEDGAVILQNAFYAMQSGGSAEEMQAEVANALGMDELPADAEAIFAALAHSVPQWEFGGASACMMEKMRHPDFSPNSPF